MAVQRDSGTWSAPIRGDVPPHHDWASAPIVVGDRSKTAADYWRDTHAWRASRLEKAPTGGILRDFVQAVRAGAPSRTVALPSKSAGTASSRPFDALE